jgi:regulator of protease activity HflC (stomatin/prohibitin superfamily)
MGISIYYILGAAFLLFMISGIRIAQEYERAVVFRLGRFHMIKGPGMYWLIPFAERQKLVDQRTRTVDMERQETITKDSVTIKVNAVLWYRVTDVAKAILQVANYGQAVYQVSVTSLRNIIGQNQLDEVLKDRDKINENLQRIVNESTADWGIRFEMVEMKDVEIPEGMQRAMAREAEAIREKRARIIKAEAELEASEKLSLGARQIAENPIALELRRLQTISEIGADNNTTTIILMPSEFSTLAKNISNFIEKKKS